MSRSRKSSKSRNGDKNNEQQGESAREISAEMRASLLAALMDDLGTIRLENLPLADDGRRDEAPGALPTLDPNSRWAVVQNTAQTDSLPAPIANGQLYRIRRTEDVNANRAASSTNQCFSNANTTQPRPRSNQNYLDPRGIHNASGSIYRSIRPTASQPAQRGKNRIQNRERIDFTLQTLRNMPSDFKKPTGPGNGKQSKPGHSGSSTNNGQFSKKAKASVYQPSSRRRPPTSAVGTAFELNRPPAHTQAPTPRRSDAVVVPANSAVHNSIATRGNTTTASTRFSSIVINKPVGGQLQNSRWATTSTGKGSETKKLKPPTASASTHTADIGRTERVPTEVEVSSKNVGTSLPLQQQDQQFTTAQPLSTGTSNTQGVKSEAQPVSIVSREIIKARTVVLRRDSTTKRVQYTVSRMTYSNGITNRHLSTRREDNVADINDAITDSVVAFIDNDDPSVVMYQANESMPVWQFRFNLPQDALAFLGLLLPELPNGRRANASVALQDETNLVEAAAGDRTHDSTLLDHNRSYTLLDIDGPVSGNTNDNTTVRISAETFNELIEASEGQDALVDLNEVEPEALVPERSALMDLYLDANHNDVLELVNNFLEESFLEAVVRHAHTEDVHMTTETNEFLSSHEAIQAAETLVFSVYNNTYLFSQMMRRDEQNEFVYHVARGVLALALDARDGVPGASPQSSAPQRRSVENLLSLRDTAVESPRLVNIPPRQTDTRPLQNAHGSPTHDPVTRNRRLSIDIVQIGLPYDDIPYEAGGALAPSEVAAAEGQQRSQDTDGAVMSGDKRRGSEPRDTITLVDMHLPATGRGRHIATDSDVDRLGEQLEQTLRVTSREVEGVAVMGSAVGRLHDNSATLTLHGFDTPADDGVRQSDDLSSINNRNNSQPMLAERLNGEARTRRGLAALSNSRFATNGVENNRPNRVNQAAENAHSSPVQNQQDSEVDMRAVVQKRFQKSMASRGSRTTRM